MAPGGRSVGYGLDGGSAMEILHCSVLASEFAQENQSAGFLFALVLTCIDDFDGEDVPAIVQLFLKPVAVCHQLLARLLQWRDGHLFPVDKHSASRQPNSQKQLRRLDSFVQIEGIAEEGILHRSLPVHGKMQVEMTPYPLRLGGWL